MRNLGNDEVQNQIQLKRRFFSQTTQKHGENVFFFKWKSNFDTHYRSKKSNKLFTISWLDICLFSVLNQVFKYDARLLCIKYIKNLKKRVMNNHDKGLLLIRISLGKCDIKQDDNIMSFCIQYRDNGKLCKSGLTMKYEEWNNIYVFFWRC